MNNIKIIKHEVFGDLIYENELPGYSGEIEYHESPLKINFVAYENTTINEQLKYAQTFLESDQFYECFIKAIQSIIIEKNKNWLEEDEAPFTEDECYDLVSLEALVFTDEEIDFYTYPLDMFWGYRVIIKFDMKCNLLSLNVDSV